MIAAAAYGLALLAVTCGIVRRGVTPPRFLFWSGLCDLTGLLIVMALLGWAMRYLRRSGAGRGADRSSPSWFLAAQAALFVLTGLTAAWVSIDFSFDGMGQGKALFGLAGRRAGCPAALMLLGAAILMAWQTSGRTHAGWQYAAFAAGLLFTSSLGWSGIDAQSGVAGWLGRGETLLISAGMMTFMSGYGLARFLPARSEWIPRARSAMPVFAAITLAMLFAVLLRVLWAISR